MRIKKTIIVLFFIIEACVFGGVNTLINLRQISIEQKLPGVTVQCIYQDRYGIIWIGIESVGLCKYDGQEFTIYENIPNDSTSISNNFVTCILEDNFGNLWIGTTGGLNKFDRNKGRFQRFLYKEDVSNSISGNYIYDLFMDQFGYLWIGTSNGLTKYNPQKGEFLKLLNAKETNETEIVISTIREDSKGNIWIGSWHRGLMQISGRNNLLNSNEWKTKSVDELENKLSIDENFLREKNNLNEFEYLDVRELVTDNFGNIFIGTNKGVYLYNIFKSEMERFSFKEYGLEKFDESIIVSMEIDRFYQLWVGSASNGLVLFDLNSKEIEYFDANDKRLNGLKSNSIRSIIEDNSGLVWIGTKFQGIQIYDPRQTTFEHIQKTNSINGLNHSFILSIMETVDEQLWVGTKEGGVNIFDKEFNVIQKYVHQPTNKNSVSSNRIEHMLEDNEHIWLGTNVSLERFDKKSKRFDHFGNMHVRFIEVLDEDKLWVGTNMDGIYIFNKKNNTLSRYESKNTEFFQNKNLTINKIFKDSKGTVWIGTGTRGLYRYRPETDKLRHYKLEKNDSLSISGSMIRAIFEDKDGFIWIGTKSDGINVLKPNGNVIRHISENEGLPSNTIYNIMQDENGDFWMATHNGISKYIKGENRFENFSVSYGLQGKVYEVNAYCKSKFGTMYVGGSNGFNYFDPLKTSRKKYIAPVIISSFKVFDEVVDLDITKSKEYVLDYDDEYISFNYSILDYSDPINNKYAYKLENFDSDWIYSGNRHYTSYTSLPAGEYIFRVKGANMDNDWNEEGMAIKLVINAPFWIRTWFIVAMIFAAGLIVLALYLYRVNLVRKNEKYLMKVVKQKTGDLQEANQLLESQKGEIEKHNTILIEQSHQIKLQNEELEQHRTQLEQLVSERTKDLEIAKQKAEESDLLKSAFLANMSHEIRTPLNAIVGFSDLLSTEDYDKNEMRRINKVIKNNSHSLLQIINDIIDISKIEANQLVINKADFKLNTLLVDLYYRYKAQIDMYCREKGYQIELILEIDKSKDGVVLVNDAFRIEQIFTNLFSNAMKFTKAGMIKMGYELSADKKFIQFYMRDTGIGISDIYQKVIFDRFRKIEEDKSNLYRGTGLGLSISSNLAELMGGEIWVESQETLGSKFTFTIPYNVKEVKEVVNTKKSEAIKKTPNWSGKHLLLVEDETSNIDVLKTMLSKTKIKISVAFNGIEAVEYATKGKDTFNIILMDIKLPHLNGIEATKKIKAYNPDIPIIAQTAYAMHDEEKEIMKIGFNEYIAKPIMAKDLFALMDTYL